MLVVSDRKYAPRCSVCGEPIMPEPGQEETVRIVALDRSFHVNCYVCEVSFPNQADLLAYIEEKLYEFPFFLRINYLKIRGKGISFREME